MSSTRAGLWCGLTLLALALVTAGAQAAAPAGRHDLQVTSFPSGAEIWIDGVSTGRVTPATIPVAMGERLVMVKSPGNGWTPAQQSVVVGKTGGSVALTLVPQLIQGPAGPPGPAGAPGGPGAPGPAGPPGPAGLGIPESVTVHVDCNAGQTIAAALAPPALSLTIFITGTCEEWVFVGRDNVTLRGGLPGAGLRAPSSDQRLLTLWGARNVRLQDLVLQGGLVALQVTSGSSFNADNVEITGASYGVQVTNAHGSLNNCRIHDNQGGFNTHLGAYLWIQNTDIFANAVGIGSNGGEIDVQGGTTIRDNTSFGVFAMDGVNVEFHDASVSGNGTGVFLASGSNGMLMGTHVSNNLSDGITLMTASIVTLYGGAVVEGNRNGVSASDTSAVMANSGSAVRLNTGDGVYLGDTATLFVNGNNPPAVIEQNGGWGVRCAPIPDLPGIHGTSFPPEFIGANTLGRINCPGLVVP